MFSDCGSKLSVHAYLNIYPFVNTIRPGNRHLKLSNGFKTRLTGPATFIFNFYLNLLSDLVDRV